MIISFSAVALDLGEERVVGSSLELDSVPGSWTVCVECVECARCAGVRARAAAACADGNVQSDCAAWSDGGGPYLVEPVVSTAIINRVG